MRLLHSRSRSGPGRNGGRQFHIEDFAVTPIYEWQLKQWIKKGYLPDIKDAFAAYDLNKDFIKAVIVIE